MKKRIFCIIAIILIFIPTVSEAENEDIMESQKETLGISNFIEAADKYSSEVLDGVDIGDLVNDAIGGKINTDTIFKKIISLFGSEVQECIRAVASILVIIIIHSILKSITESLGNDSVGQITYYAQYILIVTIIMNNLSNVLSMIRETISNLVGFMNTLVPLLITLIISTGSAVSGAVIQPILLFIINFIGNAIEVFFIPFILISSVLSIISNISSKAQIEKIAKFFNSSVVWTLGIVLTVFVGVLSLEGTLSSSVDGITAKATKAAVSSVIPVVGKILGDTVDTVMGCSLILKNAVGMVGVVIIIGICIMPILKLTVLTITYSLTAAIIQPVADEKIVKLMEQISGMFKLLLGILCVVSVMLIIGVTLVIRISNSGMMYR